MTEVEKYFHEIICALNRARRDFNRLGPDYTIHELQRIREQLSHIIRHIQQHKGE